MEVPIIMIFICIVGGGAILLYMKKTENKPMEKEDMAAKTANEWINVKDIKDNFLYTIDGKILTYIQIHSISADLLSAAEKKQLIKSLTAELSALQSPFKLLCVSRPVDISPLIEKYSELMQDCGPVRKQLLKIQSRALIDYSTSGETVERQFYAVLWSTDDEDESDLLRRSREFVSKFTSVKLKAEMLKQQDIVRLCNLVYNPAYVHLEDFDCDATMPLITGNGG